MSEDLKIKTISGLTWSAIDSVASQGIVFIIGIVLARLLSPAEFGTLGIALIFVGLFERFVDCGFSSALIRNNRVTQIDYSTAFIFNIIISVVLYLCCYYLSPLFSNFFNNEDLCEVLRWLSLIIIINAFGIIQKVILIKKIDFKTQTIISLLSSIISGIIGIASAYYGCGIMSLVYQQLCRQSLISILLWLFNKWLPKFEFSIDSFKSQFSYGIKLLLSGLIDYLFNESASFVIGKFNSHATLGQYSRAKQYSSVFSSNISTIVERVTFPVLAKFQEDKKRLVLQYKKIVKCLMLICGFLMITLACTAESVVLITVGERWTQAIVFLKIICFNDLFYPIRIVNLNAIKVTGRSDYILKVTICKRLIQIIPIVIGIYNIYYMLWGFVVTGFFGLILNSYFSSKCIPYTIKEQILDISKPLIVCVVPGVVMYLIPFLDFSIYMQLFLQLIIGFSILLLILEVTKFKEYIFIKEVCFSILKSIKLNK